MKLRPRSAMKPTSEASPGHIPAAWDFKRLKYLAKFRSGEGITSEEIGETGEHPVYGGNGLRGYTNRYTHDGDFVLIGRQGALCGNINYASGRFWASEHAIVATLRPGHSVVWFGELLRTLNLNQYSQSAAQPGLAVERIQNLFAPIPPSQEQKRIAAFLDAKLGRLDELMRKKERQLALLAEKRQALISHAVTRGLNSNAPTKPSGIAWLGDIPTHWDLKRLKFVASVQGGLAKGKDWEETETIELPYLRVANVQDSYLDLSEVKTITVGVREARGYLLRKGDVLMNEGGDLDKLGRGTVWEGQIDPCLHQNHVFAIRPHRIDPYWFASITRSGYSKAFFMQVGKQTTNLASVSASNLVNLPITVPPPAELAFIRAFLDSALSQSAAFEQKLKLQLSKFHEYRQALITAAVTGQIDVGQTSGLPVQEASGAS